MGYGSNDIVEVECSYLHETDHAILIETADGKEVWLPKLGGKTCWDATTGMVSLPEWLAEQRELI